MSADLRLFEGSVICDDRCELGEGCTYEARIDTAWWLDIKGKRLYGWQVEGNCLSRQDLPFLASTIVPIDAERQLVVADVGLLIRNRETVSFQPFLTVETNPATRSNDSRTHPSGVLWTSRMGRKAEQGMGAIFHVSGQNVTKLYDGLTIPNGICFSPDGTVGYFVDSRKNHFMRVELDPATGLPVGEARIFADESGSPGSIDGAVCDAEGNVWFARWGAGSIDVHGSDGNKLRRYQVPTLQVSCPALIGAGANRLMATTAWEDMDEAGRAKDPLAGQTFELAVNVKGSLDAAFRL